MPGAVILHNSRLAQWMKMRVLLPPTFLLGKVEARLRAHHLLYKGFDSTGALRLKYA
jgi:hypothetical protein